MFKQKSIILLGAPGSGKSSVLCELREKGIPVNSFSIRVYTQMLQKRNDKLAEEINRVAIPNKLMPIEVVEKILNVFLEQVKKEDFLVFEGFPINREQADLAKKVLLNGNRDIDAVIYLKAEKNVTEKRILQRKVCYECERKKLVGISYDSNETQCKICGKKLQTRIEDTKEQFQIRYKLHTEQHDYILKILNNIPLIAVDTTYLSKEDVVEKIIRELKLV